MDTSKRIVIIGAGPCGLGAGYRLQELGVKDWQIYEKNAYVGGLSASFQDDKGFTWDIGGHVIFSHYKYFDDLLDNMLGNDYLKHRRQAYIRLLERWIPYPFQNNIRYLPVREAWECLGGLFSAGRNKETAHRNFKEWILAQFGGGIAKYFMFPHNLKVWAHPLEEMSYSWISERVSIVGRGRALANFLFARKDASWGPNSVFKFPISGGTGEIFRRMLPYLNERLSLNKEAVNVDTVKKEIVFSDGTKTNYDILINTMPLDKLIKAAGLTALFGPAGALRHNSVLAVGLGLKKEKFSDRCWVYFPEKKSPFYRVTYFSNYSPRNAPSAAHSSLICETAYSDLFPYDKDKIIEDTIQGLINTGVLAGEDKKKVVSTYLMHAEYAYPIPTLDRDKALDAIQPYLKKKGIYSCGRFGAWKYEFANTDYSLMQGVEAVDIILGK
jgi:protoporphyrinogen oxidase